MTKGIWLNGNKQISGQWDYISHNDTFHIQLNSRDRITGLQREFWVKNERPEWGNWKLQKEAGK